MMIGQLATYATEPVSPTLEMSLIIESFPDDEPWGMLKVRVTTKEIATTADLLSQLRAISVLYERRAKALKTHNPAMAATTTIK
jgi:hypothetical protein